MQSLPLQLGFPIKNIERASMLGTLTEGDGSVQPFSDQLFIIQINTLKSMIYLYKSLDFINYTFILYILNLFYLKFYSYFY